MLQHLHLLRHNSLASCLLILLLRQGSHSTPVNLLDVIWYVLLVQIVFVELWKHFSYVVDHELGQLSIVVFDDEAEELSVIVVHDVSHLLFERKWRQLFPFEFGVVFANMHDVHFILYLKRFIHFIRNNGRIETRLRHVITLAVIL